MKLCAWRKDGGPKSTVTGFFLIEWKRAFTIVLLRFSNGTRDAYHSHAFNAVSWLLRGQLTENRLVSNSIGVMSIFRPSLIPIITTRSNCHKVHSEGTSWVISFRGPWVKLWHEFVAGRRVRLTHGRKMVA